MPRASRIATGANQSRRSGHSTSDAAPARTEPIPSPSRLTRKTRRQGASVCCPTRPGDSGMPTHDQTKSSGTPSGIGAPHTSTGETLRPSSQVRPAVRPPRRRRRPSPSPATTTLKTVHNGPSPARGRQRSVRGAAVAAAGGPACERIPVRPRGPGRAGEGPARSRSRSELREKSESGILVLVSTDSPLCRRSGAAT